MRDSPFSVGKIAIYAALDYNKPRKRGRWFPGTLAYWRKGRITMQNVITVATMRDSDAHTIAEYTPSRELMHRAALGVYQAADWTGKTVAILTGGGNNGGDGYALAAILAGKGIPCQLYRVSEKFSADGKFYYDQAIEAGVPADVFTKETDLSGYDILVDCLLGTGFNGPVRGLFYEAIQAINQSKAYVISVDINSGMNGDTGKGGPVVKSDLTVTIGYLKAGMLLGDAVWSIGKLVVADIGIRLIRDDYFLAKPEEAVFPHSDLSLDGDHVTLLTPGEAEDLSKAGQTIPDVAQELALRSRRLVRVLGRYALATDGYRTYFLEAGEYPQVIQVG